MKIKCCILCYQDNIFELNEGDIIKIVDEAICEIE